MIAVVGFVVVTLGTVIGSFIPAWGLNLIWLVMGSKEHYETAYRMQCIHVCNTARRRAVRFCFLYEPGCDRLRSLSGCGGERQCPVRRTQYGQLSGRP